MRQHEPVSYHFRASFNCLLNSAGVIETKFLILGSTDSSKTPKHLTLIRADMSLIYPVISDKAYLIILINDKPYH